MTGGGKGQLVPDISPSMRRPDALIRARLQSEKGEEDSSPGSLRDCSIWLELVGVAFLRPLTLGLAIGLAFGLGTSAVA
jgi:hypothetical protein